MIRCYLKYIILNFNSSNQCISILTIIEWVFTINKILKTKKQKSLVKAMK